MSGKILKITALLILFFSYSYTSYALEVGLVRDYAKLSAVPLVGTTDTRFTFQLINLPENEKQGQGRFDFENDGAFDTPYISTLSSERRFTAVGMKSVLAEIKDKDGNAHFYITTVLVKERDFAPEVDLRISGNYGIQSSLKAVRGGEIQFLPRVRDDHDQNRLKARYDFNGDGIFDTAWEKVSTKKHTFETSGEKKVILEVIDSNGNTADDSAIITIVDNTPPTAVLKSDKIVGTTGTEFTFDASKSFDNQAISSQLQVHFDFNSDGIFDTPLQNSKTVKKLFSRAGIFVVTLETNDPEGLTGRDYQKIEILKNTKPIPSLIITPKEGTFETIFSFDASGSTDGQTDFMNLKFRFDTDYLGEQDMIYDNPNFSAQPKTTKRFQKVGTLTIKAEIRDENGEISTIYDKIAIHWASPYIEYLKRNSVMRGYKDGSMRPEQEITRAEFLSLIMKAKKINYTGAKFKTLYSDVTQKDWFWQIVLKAQEMGIITKNQSFFRPLASISRAEALSMLMKTFQVREGHHGAPKQFIDVNGSEWYTENIQTASKIGVIDGYADGTFRPAKSLKRGEAAKIVAEAMRRMR